MPRARGMPGSRIWYPPRGLAVQQMAAFRHTHNLVFTPSFLHRTIGWGASFRLSEKWPRLLVRRDQALSARTRCWSGRPKFGLARFVPPLMSNVECLLWPRATVRSWPTAEIKKRGWNDRYGQGSGVPLSVIKMPNCLHKSCWNE